jgi:DNA polymerase III alpha subunit
VVYNVDNKKILPHPSGVYLERVPVDLLTGNAAIDYNRGDALGFFKVDILTNTSYDGFKSKQDLLEHANKTPDWDLLHKQDVVGKLPHISKHFDLVVKVSPHSVESLADCLALIRPGKTHLIDEYLENPEQVRRRLYLRPKEGVYFKKSHAISYALMIVCILNKTHDSGILW